MAFLILITFPVTMKADTEYNDSRTCEHLPLISVIIPNYNNEKYLDRCIQSVTNQSYKNIEIIIIDDGSTDRSLDICRSYSDKDKRITIFKNKNRGAAFSRNYGISKSNGEYIQFLDSDDYISHDKFEHQVELLRKRPPNTLVFCGYTNVYGQKKAAVKNTINHDYKFPVQLIFEMWQSKEFIAIHSYLIPRVLINVAGLWNQKLTSNDDGEFMTRIILSSSEVIFDDSSQSFYVFKAGSLSKQKEPDNFISRLDSYRLILKHIENFYAKTEVLPNKNINGFALENFRNYFKIGISELLIETYIHDKSLYEKMSRNYNELHIAQSRYKIYNFLSKLIGTSNAFLIYNNFFLRIDKKL